MVTYDDFLPCPLAENSPIIPEMRIEERRALCILIHALRPDVIVETGCFKGGSASFMASHGIPVISIDPNPIVSEETFAELKLPVEMVRKPSQGVLPRIGLQLHGKRWMFLHDSVHHEAQLYHEVTTALKWGAIVAVWHDVGWAMDNQGSMLDGLKRLQAEGYPAHRTQHFGVEETRGEHAKDDLWTGLGICWPKVSNE